MATAAATAADAARKPGLLARLFSNEVLAVASIVLAVAVVVAIVRGAAHWGRIPPLIWVHLGAMLVATVLAPVMLLRRKGTLWHRRLGYVWMSSMLVAAATSLFFKSGAMGPGHLGVFTGDVSPIHALSVFVLVQAPRAVMQARRHDRRRHERTIRALVIGALLVAGFFTFPFNRLLGSWLFG